MTLRITQDERGDQLLDHDAFALLTGMLLDQQFPMERAFYGPRLIADRLLGAGLVSGDGERLDPAVVAAVPAADFTALMTGPPAVHRYPQSMGTRVQDLARIVLEEYGGDAEQLWRGAGTGPELVARVRRLPGFGAQKAKIFVALLAKQKDVRPPGWEEAVGDYSLAGYRSVADVVDEASLAKVRETKKQVKAAARATSTAGAG